MKRWILGIALGFGAWPAAAAAQQTPCISFLQNDGVLGDVVRTCGPYVHPVDPGPGETYAIRFALAAGLATEGWVYYTTDSSAPSGAQGVGSGNTKVASAALSCSFDDGLSQDVFEASIPAFDPGTRVRFILSAWKDGGAENFLAQPADGGSQCSAASADQAQVFEVTVTQAAPKPVPDVIMVAMDTPRALSAKDGLMANDRFVTADTIAVANTDVGGMLEVGDDGSLAYRPSPGYSGEIDFSYFLAIDSQEYSSTRATVRLLVRPASGLVQITDEPSGETCPTGGKRIDVGVDNGAGGTIPFDGKLDGAEVTSTSYACNGAVGAAGAAALVTTAAEPAGANCAKGGQKVEAGVDSNGNGVLDASEVTSTAYVCTGATGKSGCGAAPGELSGLFALAPIAWLGLRRRRFEKEGRR